MGFIKDMQITSIGNNFYNRYNLTKPKTPQNQAFGAWYRDVYISSKKIEKGSEILRYNLSNKKVNNLVYRNNTVLFRNGMELPKIMDAIVNLHESTPKIHTRFYGCSDGSEVYSCYMYLLSKYGENVLSKFKPFKAMDIDAIAIQKAKEGKIPISYDEFFRIQEYTKDRFNQFFDAKDLEIPNIPLDPCMKYPRLEKIFSGATRGKDSVAEGCVVKINEKYLKDIEYSVADVTKDMENIEPENSVTSLRNFMPYLTDSEIITLARKLGKRLKKDSCLIFGDYDFNPDRSYGFNFTNLFFDNGFEKLDTGVGSSFVFKKT